MDHDGITGTNYTGTGIPGIRACCTVCVLLVAETVCNNLTFSHEDFAPAPASTAESRPPLTAQSSSTFTQQPASSARLFLGRRLICTHERSQAWSRC